MNKFTLEQQAAIAATGKTIVSASAGSGKTTVMIEKLLGLMSDGMDVSRILAVTYTRKAAAQMKDKLRREAIKKINSPDTDEQLKKRLKKQLPKIAGADISTIHSFCARLIRSHFYVVDADADFSIVGEDDSQGAELQARAVDSLFEEAYENEEEKFAKLLSVYRRSKKDSTLKQLILSAYARLRTREDYIDFLSVRVEATEEKFNRICAELLRFLKEECAYYASKIEDARALFEGIEGCEPSVKNADELIAALAALAEKENYFSACKEPLPPFSDKQKMFKGAPSDFDENRTLLGEYKEKVKSVYAELSAIRPRETELSDYLCAGEAASILAEYLLRFDKRYSELKREKNFLDYADLEHMTLKLLSDEDIVREVHEKYAYVFVDEYQDVNPVQEKIISLVSGENLFLVGDVKQAIYGFRGSKSEYFVQKQKSFSEDEKANSLLLTKNFRSSSAILRAVNEEFCFSMTPDVSETDYLKDSVMQGGDRYEDNEGRVFLHITETEKKKKEKRVRNVYSVEENYLKERSKISDYGRRMRELVEKEHNLMWYDADEGVMRRVEYSDIAILTRKNRGAEETIAALAEAGVPVTAASVTNVCLYPEIRTLIDILKYIDNEKQDIPLCSALLSAAGNLTADDLTNIRLAYPDERFFRDCAKRYAEEKNDALSLALNRFYEYFSALRILSATADAGELLTKILVDTHMEARLLSKENGSDCLKRIHCFLSYATGKESMFVHDFLDFLREIEYSIPYGESGGENAVRVMTMHASKGLEYPVVFLCDVSKGFAGEDEKELMIDGEFGLATKCYRRETMTYSPTLFWKLCKKREQTEEVKNELNLFYVALTRAKYALHVTSASRLPECDVRYAKCYAQFMPYSVWKKYLDDDAPFVLPKNDRQSYVSDVDEELKSKILRELTHEYAFSGGENLPVKRSASALMKERENEARDTLSLLVPEDEEAFRGKTDVESGLAYHAFLQHFDLYGYFSAEDRSVFLRENLETLRQRGKIEKERFALLNENKIHEILRLPVFSEIAKTRIVREQEFIAALSVSDVYDEGRYKNSADEKIIFQGSIDLLSYSEDGKIRIADYKYSTKNGAELLQKYRLQLNLYKKATAAITGVEEKNIRCTIVNIFRGFEVDAE